MNASVGPWQPKKKEEETYTGRYSKEFRNQNYKYLVNLYESNNPKVNYPDCQNIICFLPVEIANNKYYNNLPES